MGRRWHHEEPLPGQRSERTDGILRSLFLPRQCPIGGQRPGEKSGEEGKGGGCGGGRGGGGGTNENVNNWSESVMEGLVLILGDHNNTRRS